MISVCIPTKNSASTLRSTLDSVRSFPEVIVLDNGSTDDTCQIAQNYKNVRIARTDFTGFGALRNKAAALATHDWILALDSDEIVSDSLLRELLDLIPDPHNAYSIPRHNYYNGKRIRGCGWGSDRVVRLYHRHSAQFNDRLVHEALAAEKIAPLRSPLLHTPYRSTADFLAKMQHYSTLFAEQNYGKKKSSVAIAFTHGLYAFFRSYILQKGFLCGPEGFVISLYNANTSFYKYLKIKDLSK